MLKWAVAVAAVLVLVGLLLWKVVRPTEDSPSSPLPSPVHAVLPLGSRAPHPSGGPALADDAGPPPPTTAQLDPKSEAYSQRLDVGIPARLRGGLAGCYHGDRDPDLALHIRYRLQIHHGDASAINVGINDSKLGDPALEQCMVEAIRGLRWREEDMPDTSEDDVLFVRLMTLVKYKSADEQAKDKATAHRVHTIDAGP